MVGLILACAEPSPEPAPTTPVLGPYEVVVPGEGLPADLPLMDSNNNLDIIEHDGGVFLAFRTAPSHFASDQTLLHVLRSEDRQTWSHEATISMGTDLREPRLFSWQGQLFLYFAVLGTDALAFEPQGTMRMVRDGGGAWSEPEWWRTDGFIPWRIRVVEGVLEMVGYTGGEDIYALSEDGWPQLEVRWLMSEDGREWSARWPGQEVVHVGGASETDLARAADGAVIAVLRNEAGEPGGFGSLICRGEPEDPAAWTCRHDPKKYDSPLVFAREGRIWLVGRRSLSEDGHYDLSINDPSYDEMSAQEQALAYQAAWWGQPKRCSLWEVDPDSLEVRHTLDLASKGDTCFASLLEEPAGDATLYNYSSDPEGAELSWLEGQMGATWILRQRLEYR